MSSCGPIVRRWKELEPYISTYGYLEIDDLVSLYAVGIRELC